MIIKIADFAWVALTIPKIASYLWQSGIECRNMHAGVILTTAYLLSAVVMGLVGKSDLQAV